MGNFKCFCKKNIIKNLTEKFTSKYTQMTVNTDLIAITKNERIFEDNDQKKKGIKINLV